MQKIKRRFLKLLFFAFAVLMSCTMIKFIMFPELYLTSWKYQLEKEVRVGEPEAVEYYQRRYIGNGIELF